MPSPGMMQAQPQSGTSKSRISIEIASPVSAPSIATGPASG